MKRLLPVRQWLLLVVLLGSVITVVECLAETHAPAGWSTFSPREELQPQFGFQPGAGPGQSDCFVISADQRLGLIGGWTKTFAVEGGRYYRFHVLRRATGVAVPRRTAVARLLWHDERGRAVLRDKPSYASYRPGERPRTEPEFPRTGALTTTAGQRYLPSIVPLRQQLAPSSSSAIAGRPAGRSNGPRFPWHQPPLPTLAKPDWPPCTFVLGKGKRRPRNADCSRR